MKQCPYCTTNNRDDAAVCAYCGRDITQVAAQQDQNYYVPQPPQAGTTQPLNMRPVQPQQPYQPPYPTQGQAQGYPAQQPMPQGQYYPPQQAQPQPQYYPPAPPIYSPASPPRAKSGSRWGVLAVILLLVLFCAGGLALWTVFSAANSGVASLVEQFQTQVAGAIPSPTEAPTPEPTQPPEVTQPQEGDQSAGMEKLLSPECASAVDRLSTVSSEISSQPLRLAEESWRENLNLAMEDMKTYCGSLETASPIPGQAAEVRENLNQASYEYDQAKQLWTEGIEQRSPGKLLEAAQHLQKSVEHLNLATDGLKEIVQ